LLTPPEELAYASLYFTGSKEFNTEFRKIAISRGYSLNEHKLSKLVPVAADVPFLKTERDVFEFLRIKYQSPEQRSGAVETY
jgi:DNA polymerase/3'-5' exonuclease PolX